MIGTDKPISRKHRRWILTVIAIGIYPVIGTLLIRHLWYWLRELGQSGDSPADFGYTLYAGSFGLLWGQIMIYDLWSYLLFVHLCFLTLSGHFELHTKRYLAPMVYSGLLFFVDMILLPQSSIASVFPEQHVLPRLALLFLIALLTYPLYSWVLNRPVSEQ